MTTRAKHSPLLWILFGLFSLLTTQAWAQQEMQVRAVLNPEKLLVGEVGRYEIYLSDVPSKPDNLQTPEVKGLQFGQMSQQSYSTTNIIGRFGNFVTRQQYVYSWPVAATRTGTFTIPGQTLTIDGIDYKLEDKLLTVQEQGDVFRDMMDLQLELPDDPVYVGQMVSSRIILRIRQDARVEAAANAPPSREGDDVQEIYRNPRPERREQTLNGKRYVDFVWRFVFSPTRAGPHEIRFTFPMRMYDADTGRYRQVVLYTRNGPLQVAPLPEQDQPASFTGGIGQFDVDYKWSADTVATGEPLELSLTVNGNGNLARMSAPTIPESSDWRAYPPRVEQNQNEDTGIATAKTFDYVLIPESPAIQQTPEVKLAWFDPKQGRYHETTVEPQALTVTGEPTASSAPRQQAASAEPQVPTRPGIGPLASAPGTFRPDLRPLFYRTNFWVANLAAAFVLALLGFVRWKRLRLETQPHLRARTAHLQEQERRLQAARQAARQEDADQFFHAAVKALQTASAPPGMPPEAVTPEMIQQRLISAGLPEEEQQALTELLHRGDALRYGGRMQQTDFKADLKRVEHAVQQLQAQEKHA
ncbi:MAG: hypothetical protein E1N59_1865 [Puniceicoccaceae bacterium 5H]|nr:MAG: hypothetical protein E1N59_1865 [Puniceicoccaceae bacterium 5H]